MVGERATLPDERVTHTPLSKGTSCGQSRAPDCARSPCCLLLLIARLGWAGFLCSLDSSNAPSIVYDYLVY